MSDSIRAERATVRDQGMTLVELLVSIMMLGLIMIVLSSAIIVTFRQQDNTEGRLNVARAEQTVSMWIPADLSSASVVDTSPEVTPCGATVCDGIDLSAGSNVLMLSWTSQLGDGTVVATNVSYHFAPSGDGETFVLSRVECNSTGGGPWTCSSTIVLRDLPGPPAGDPFVPGVANGANCNLPVDPVPCTRPDWVIIVSEPLAADAIDNATLATDADRKDANRVIVSINGGGDSAGAGGGVNQISITAGGTVRSEIAANSVQGAPSFVEARSRCGGPVTLVIDESGSIGGALADVKVGVRRFVESLAGTPVQLQIVRFSTYSSILGSTDWHRYTDMTNQAEVDALLGAIDGLVSNGGTNWEEAMFRTFYNADGSTASIIPETVVFFTDGVPTYDRMVRRTSPGVLPVDPPAPGLPWATSNGGDYSQVAFKRADYIANIYRQSVRFIGVGVGGIMNNSNWVVNPGAGYRMEWERGSFSHVRDTLGPQAMYQKKNTGGGAWYFVNKSTYDAAANNRRQIVPWTAISQSQYDSINTSPDDTDGVTLVTSTPVTTAEYSANVANPLYRAVTKTWNAGPDWEAWTGDRPGSSSHYRSTKVYNSPPYEAYDPAVTASTKNHVILARLISGNDNGTPANWDGTTYANADIADMYVLPEWNQFDEAMTAAALGECGGTVTLQTKIGGTTPAPDPFKYQNSAVTDSAGAPISLEPTVVTTSQQAVTGTFDFEIPGGQFVTVDIVPQNYALLTGYTPGAWTCRAGNQDRAFTLIDIPGAGAWKGVRVEVRANEAVSCTLSVTR